MCLWKETGLDKPEGINDYLHEIALFSSEID